MEQLITSSYEHKLAHAFHKIDNRGILCDAPKLAKLRVWMNDEINRLCSELSQQISYNVYIGAANGPAKDDQRRAINLNAHAKLLDTIKFLGYTVPKIRRKNKESHEYEFVESTNDLVMQKILADPVLWPINPAFDAGKVIKSIMEVKEIITIRNRYVNAKLHNDAYYSNHSVTSTVTGRRGSKKHIFGVGNNDQNFPKYSELGHRYRDCLIARPGKIFFFVDQKSAEEWPVQALAENYTALDEMRLGINRHVKLASYIFKVPEATLKAGRKSDDELVRKQAEMWYYLGKKTRHAYNYGMRPARMSEQLAAEGFSISKAVCEEMLKSVAEAEPNVDAVFHNYIKEQLFSPTKLLRTPLGRERQFFGLRPNDKNYELLNEAYSYIPQSTVGDNTGLAILYLDGCNDYVTQDGHDSICQEVPDDEITLLQVFRHTEQAFDRRIVFHNGIEVNIPIEGELAYDWGHTVKLAEYTEDCLIETYRKFKAEREQTNAESLGEALA